MSVPAAEYLDAALVRSWMAGAVRALEAARGDLDRVNVFPVADADTGTNMYATLVEALRRIDREPLTLPETFSALAAGALAGARGNSGTILGAYLQAMADDVEHMAPADAAGGALDGPGCARLLDAGARAAHRAVAEPAPGTILTAASAAAEAAIEAARTGRGVGSIAVAARDGARAAAQRSARELPTLARSGVLDAGALGLVVVLDALAVAAGEATRALPGVSVAAGMMAGVEQPAEGEFEVVCAVTVDDAAADSLRRELAAVGTSLVIAGGASDHLRERRVHIHTDDPAAVVALGAAAAERCGGTVSGVRVRALQGEDVEGVSGPEGPVSSSGPVSFGPVSSAPGSPAAPTVVAFTTAPGLLADLARAGATVRLDTGAGAPVSVMVGPGPADVIVLPARALGAGERADLVQVLGARGARVDVVESTANVQVVAALGAALAADPGHALPAMRRAVAATGVLQVRDGMFPPVPPGAVVTVLADDDADHAALAAWAGEVSLRADVQVVAAGKPGTGVEIGIEAGEGSGE